MRSFLIQLESWEAALKSGFSDDDSSSSYHALGIAKLLGWVRYPGGRKRRHSTIPRERGLPRGLVGSASNARTQMRNSFVFFIREASSLDVSLLHTRIDANGGLATSLWGTAPVAGKRTAFWVLFLVTQAESYTGRDLPPRAVPRSARAPAERGSTIPKRLGRTQEMLRHFIEFAAKMMEWAALSEAVEVMIRQQREFCEWWTGAVHHKGGERWLDNQDRCYQGIPMRQAESETGISQQREFCQWWSEHVTPGLRMGSNQWVVAERGPTTSAAQAEQDTGVTKQQVSRWSHALANEDAYRFAITDAACRKAGIEPARKSSCRQVNTF